MTLWEIMVGYPGSQDINQHPYYPYRLAKLAWHIYHHSFTKNGRWFLAGTAIANLSFTMFWSFDIQTWILATAINCLWLPDFIAKLLPIHDTAILNDRIVTPIGQEVSLLASDASLSPNSVVHFDRLPLALEALHDEGFASNGTDGVEMGLIGRFRGKWDIPSIRISRPGPFGLIARSKVIPTSAQICVLPPFPQGATLVTANAVVAEMRSAQLERKLATSSSADILRTHSPGDPSNRIDWRASSRSAATARPELQVRLTHESTEGGVHIIIDERVIVNRISPWQHWSGRGVREPLPIPDFEDLVSLAYACAMSAMRDGISVSSIRSQRQQFTKLVTLEDIAEAIAHIAHCETSPDAIQSWSLPELPGADAYVFSLIPQYVSYQPNSNQDRPVRVIADLRGVYSEATVNA